MELTSRQPFTNRVTYNVCGRKAFKVITNHEDFVTAVFCGEWGWMGSVGVAGM